MKNFISEKNILIYEDGRESKIFDTDFSSESSYTDMGGGLTLVRISVKNESDRERKIKVIYSLTTAFEVVDYTVPSVLYNGNDNADRGIPTGLVRDGESWIFAYDRVSLPSCTLTQNRDSFCALFASDENEASLRSSCSMIRLERGAFEQRIYYPVTEAPYTYSNKRKFTERYEEYLTLGKGEVFSASLYVLTGVPVREHYAYENLLDCAVKVFPDRKKPIFTQKELYDSQIKYLNSLVSSHGGKPFVAAYYDTPLAARQAGRGKPITPDEMIEMAKEPKNLEFFLADHAAAGFSSQGILSERMLLLDAINRGDEKDIKRALEMLDCWIELMTPSGLAFSRIPESPRGSVAVTNTCVIGQQIYEMTGVAVMLKNAGLGYQKYLGYAKKMADAMIEKYDDSLGFGVCFDVISGARLSWDGEMRSFAPWIPERHGLRYVYNATGGFVLAAMSELYLATGEEKYLTAAIRASDFYYTHFLDRFTCSGGAIDCQSVDRESAYPFLRSSMSLYKITKDEKYLERAKMAAVFFTSFTVFYDALYPADSEFTKYGYSTQGATFVGAEHPATDPYGVITVPELYELTRLTGDKKWKIIADMMWKNGMLGITPHESYEMRGQHRPVGSQSEATFPCRWTKYRPTCEERGHFVDFLPAWVTAFRLYAMSQKEFDFEENK